MKLKSLTLILAVALGAQVAFAQQSQSDPSVEFNPHWYGQIMGGGAYTVGETAFKDLLSPAAALNLGYQFTPSLGLRLGLGGWQGKGNALQPVEVYKFNFLQGNLDLKLDLANLLAGYDNQRVLNPYLLLGGGAALGMKNGAKDVKGNATPFEYLWEDNKLITPVGRFGLGADVRLTEALALTLEANGNVLSDHFNSKKAGNPDYQYNVLAGLKFNFGKATRPSAKYLADLAAAEAAAAALAAQKEAERLAAEKAAAEKAAAEKAAADKLAAEKAAAAAAAADLDKYQTLNTFFELDSDVISDEEAAKLVDFIQWLNKYNHSVAICGYADVQTGRPKYNMGISSRRVENVKAFLIEHGVDASRITSDYKGDTVQPFTENDLNRVVVSTVQK